MDQMEIQAKLTAVRTNVGQVMVGKQEAVELLICALLSRGHVLIEDVPGIGKTTLVSALARSLGCSFGRIQFTPDVMPSDVTGFTMADMATNTFRYHEGAVMRQMILADEINRTSPKTQSALLEAMQEGTVTVDGETHQLPKPFMVMATQNPVDFVGTYPLPEAQMDRFIMRLSLGYPTVVEEVAILERFEGEDPRRALESVLTADEVLTLQEAAEAVTCSKSVKEYIAQLVTATRKDENVAMGASPRGSLALMQMSKARALMDGRTFVTPDDVQAMVPYVLAHRLILKPEARLKDMTAERVLRNIVVRTNVPGMS